MKPGNIGLDLIEVERMERALERRPRLARRLFTPDEISFASKRARPARHLAARFAAKEAVIKAIGEPGVGLSQIEIASAETGRPCVELSGRARQLIDEAGVEIDVSLTHSREMAAAVALVRESPPGN